jgi:hypothetical protein
MMSGKPSDDASEFHESEQLHRYHIEQRHRSRRRLTISDNEVAAMVREFIAARGGVTSCPVAYAAPMIQDDSRCPSNPRRRLSL